MMIIKFTNFSDGIHEVQLDETAEKLGLGPEFFGNVAVECKMDKSVHQIVLNCEVSANAHFVCDRCMNGFDTKILFDYKVVYFFGEGEERDEDDGTDLVR